MAKEQRKEEEMKEEICTPNNLLLIKVRQIQGRIEEQIDEGNRERKGQ